jgi:hypothetical protein
MYLVGLYDKYSTVRLSYLSGESIPGLLNRLTNTSSGIDSAESIPWEKLIPLRNLLLDTSIPCERIKDFRIVVVIVCCVWEKETPFGQHISNTQTIWQLSAGDEKSIPDIKN